jgi:Tfp pilus assembly protein PilF
MDNEQPRYKIEDSVALIVHNLRFAKKEGISCTLLIGAGCSYTAGIPLASEFVRLIEDLFPDSYKRAAEDACERARRRGELIDKETFVPTYSNCMAVLSPIFRRQLFARYVDSAKVNRAHICIASLLKAGYVDRILTTNFDPLIVQACALLGEYPAVYDFASSQHLKAHSLPAKAVFHLHGQRTGFVQLNTEEELEKHSAVLGPLMQAARNGRTWVVAGYSGENDPVFEHIANFQMDSDLFWVGYRKNDPRKHIKERLLIKKNAYYVQGYDADSFFEELTRHLGIFPPDLIARPFSHLKNFLDVISPKEEFIRETRQVIQRAIGQFEKPDSITIVTGDFIRPLAASASQQLIDDDDLRSLIADELQNQGTRPKYSDRLAWAYLIRGNLLSNRAGTMCAQEAEKLFGKAAERYQTALDHKPMYYEAINNWGVSLYYQAKTKSGAEADEIFGQAKEKFQEALNHKADYYEAMNNLGAALYEQAKNASGVESGQLLDLALKQFKAALDIKSNLYQAYNNWGNAIIHQSRSSSGREADRLFESAIKKFEDALYIESDQLQILNNWGMALLERYRTSDDESVRVDVENEIIRISGRAERVSTGGGSYLSACLNALINDDMACLMGLKKALKSNSLPSREYLLNDPNLESVRDSEWFIMLIDSAFKQMGEQTAEKRPQAAHAPTVP